MCWATAPRGNPRHSWSGNYSFQALHEGCVSLYFWHAWASFLYSSDALGCSSLHSGAQGLCAAAFQMPGDVFMLQANFNYDVHRLLDTFMAPGLWLLATMAHQVCIPVPSGTQVLFSATLLMHMAAHGFTWSHLASFHCNSTLILLQSTSLGFVSFRCNLCTIFVA